MYYPDDTTLLFRYNLSQCISDIGEVIENATHATHVGRDDSKSVTYYFKKSKVTVIGDKTGISYRYESYKSILGFKYSRKSFVVSSSNPYVDQVDWNSLRKIINRNNYRFGIVI